MLRTVLLSMSKNRQMQRFTMHSRMTKAMVERFVAGNSLDEAVQNGRRLNDQGLLLTMDHLGEAVLGPEEANHAAFEYHQLLERIAKDGLNSTISIKPTQLGMMLNVEQCRSRLDRMVQKAVSLGTSVEIDMEDSPYTDITLDIYENLLPKCPDLRVCLQAYLFRCEDDMERLINLGGSVRLVKGAYREPADVAYQKKARVDESVVELMDMGLTKEAVAKGFYLALASHDEALVDEAKDIAKRNGLDKEQFEFQFLYGIRTDLQQSLAREGYRVRIYLPYGMQWYPYFMRRLAERPANLLFLMKNMLRK